MTICDRKSGGRILCIRLSGLGDVVHALNALALLRQERPDAYIAWVVEERFADLLHGHPHVDELITLPRKDWGELLRRPLRWPRLAGRLKALAVHLREREFDVSVDFQSSVKSAWLVLAAGADLRVGFGKGVSRELNRVVQNSLVSAPTQRVHRIERDLALLAPLGIATRYASPLLPSSEPDRQAVDRALGACRTGGPLVIIHPGTSRFAAFKRWMPDRYARVADRLVAERGADVVVTHGPDERGLAEQVVSDMTERAALAPEGGGIRGLIELLRQANLFIGSDTGPMHIASALGVPVVALFGPKDPVQTGPYCSRSVVVTGTAECRPCNRRKCSDVRCMTGITVDQVLKAALTVLDSEGRCRAEDGLIRKPFALGFKLGRWKGQAAACYSSPEFYTWLCDPDAIVQGARNVESTGHQLSAPVSVSVGGARQRFVVKRYPSESRILERLGELIGVSGARNAWRCALGLRLKGVSVPFPVCYMVRASLPLAGSREHVLLTEEISGAASLREWLAADPKGRAGNSTRLSLAQRGVLIDRVAQAVRAFHVAGYYHGDLRAENIFVRTGDEPMDYDIHIVNMERTKWVGWLPPVLRDVLWGADLRRLAPGLGPAGDAARFFRSYCEGSIEGPYRRRLLKRLIGGFPACGQDTPARKTADKPQAE